MEFFCQFTKCYFAFSCVIFTVPKYITYYLAKHFQSTIFMEFFCQFTKCYFAFSCVIFTLPKYITRMQLFSKRKSSKILFLYITYYLAKHFQSTIFMGFFCQGHNSSQILFFSAIHVLFIQILSRFFRNSVSKIFQILGLQPGISKVFLDHENIFFSYSRSEQFK